MTEASLPAARRGLPFSNRTLAAVGIAGAVALGGALWINAPKASETTDAAYVQADSSVIAPKVRGLVAQVLVAHNQPVHRGDPLVRIDPEEFTARVAAAEADRQTAVAGVAAARAALSALDADERLAASNIRIAQAALRSSDAQDLRARADRARFEALATSGAVSAKDVDAYRAAAAVAASSMACVAPCPSVGTIPWAASPR